VQRLVVGALAFMPSASNVSLHVEQQVSGLIPLAGSFHDGPKKKKPEISPTTLLLMMQSARE
jgi:hypothetical protein